MIEVPALVEVLQLNKAGFIRSGKKGATFLAYRRAIQEPVAELLAQWGDAPEPTRTRRPRTRSLERDVQSVLADLTGDFPLVATLVDRKPGGQRRLPLGGGAAVTGELEDPGEGTRPAERKGRDTTGDGDAEPRDPGSTPPGAPSVGPVKEGASTTGSGQGSKKPATYGLRIDFESRPDAHAPGRLVESTLWINEAFPAYKRALASRSEGYHIALTVALALAPLVAGPEAGTDFITRFLRRWGDAAR